jgi:hypothetical protein
MSATVQPAPATRPTAAFVAPVVAVFIGQLLMAVAVIPPWQNPDEPQHLLTARLVQSLGPGFVVEQELGSPEESPIVQSMARYGWWRHYQSQTPNPVPATFADGPGKVVTQYFGPPGGGSRLYYSAVSSLFDVAAIDAVLSQMYVMRVLAAAASILALLCIWSGTRHLLNQHAALGVAALAALHPQFAIVSASASPDAFVNLAGSVVWRQSAVLLTRGTTLPGLALLWLGAVAALVLRRMGAPVVAVAAVVTLVLAWREIRSKGRSPLRALAAAGALGLAVAAVTLATVPADLSRALNFLRIDPVQAVRQVAGSAAALPSFMEMLFRTFWLAAGWLRYSGPQWWQASVALLCVVAAAGLLLVRGHEKRQALMLSAAAVLVQVVAVVIYQFGILRSGPQGRYLFPVLPAVLCLIWLGWTAIVERIAEQRAAAVSLVMAVAFLNVSAWLFVIIPAFR